MFRSADSALGNAATSAAASATTTATTTATATAAAAAAAAAAAGDGDRDGDGDGDGRGPSTSTSRRPDAGAGGDSPRALPPVVPRRLSVVGGQETFRSQLKQRVSLAEVGSWRSGKVEWVTSW